MLYSNVKLPCDVIGNISDFDSEFLGSSPNGATNYWIDG